MKSLRRCGKNASQAAAARCGGSSSDATSASKKTLYAAEQKRAEIARARRGWILGHLTTLFARRFPQPDSFRFVASSQGQPALLDFEEIRPLIGISSCGHASGLGGTAVALPNRDWPGLLRHGKPFFPLDRIRDVSRSFQPLTRSAPDGDKGIGFGDQRLSIRRAPSRASSVRGSSIASG
jgi:hypothetical protein